MSEEIISKKSVLKWWVFGLGLVVLAGVVFTALGYVGIIFETKVEREVYEESYQYKAGQKQKVAILRSQLAEIRMQLGSPGLDPAIRQQLMAKQAAIRVQLRAAAQR